MNIRPRLTFLATATLLLISSAGLQAGPFKITCQTLNAVTNQPQSSFHPGEQLLLVVTPTFPDARAARKKMNVSVSVRARIAGIAVPYKFVVNNAIPNIDPTSPGNAAVQTGTESRVYTIPPQSPNCIVIVTVKASIDSVGKAGFNKKITIQQ